MPTLGNLEIPNWQMLNSTIPYHSLPGMSTPNFPSKAAYALPPKRSCGGKTSGCGSAWVTMCQVSLKLHTTLQHGRYQKKKLSHCAKSAYRLFLQWRRSPCESFPVQSNTTCGKSQQEIHRDVSTPEDGAATELKKQKGSTGTVMNIGMLEKMKRA